MHDVAAGATTRPSESSTGRAWRSLGAIATELRRRSPLLAVIGWLHVAGLVAATVLFVVDGRTIGSESVWLKPMKFAASITIYLWTIAWLLHHLVPTDGRRVRLVAAVIGMAMLLEFVLISSQSVRGVASHFNFGSTYDVSVYRAMGVLIVINTIALAWFTVLYLLRRPPLAPSYLWGIRLGLVLFLTTALSGGMMVGSASHTVGAGDLRVAHFVAMHSLQVLPAGGLLAEWLRQHGRLAHPVRWTVALAVFLLIVHSAALLLTQGGARIPQ